MKKGKFIISLVLVFTVVLSISVCAFAVREPVPDFVINEFKNFQLIKQGHTSTYVRIAQRFLLYYSPTTSNFISQNGGVDGTFGLGTYYATYEFQTEVFNDYTKWDGVEGSETWGKIAEEMKYEEIPSVGTHYELYCNDNLVCWRVSNIWGVIGGDNHEYNIYV